MSFIERKSFILLSFFNMMIIVIVLWLVSDFVIFQIKIHCPLSFCMYDPINCNYKRKYVTDFVSSHFSSLSLKSVQLNLNFASEQCVCARFHIFFSFFALLFLLSSIPHIHEYKIEEKKIKQRKQSKSFHRFASAVSVDQT